MKPYQIILTPEAQSDLRGFASVIRTRLLDKLEWIGEKLGDFENLRVFHSTDHEYGACDYTWEFVCKKTGEVPLIQRQGRKFIHLSIQGYNTPFDVDALLEALGELLSSQPCDEISGV